MGIGPKGVVLESERVRPGLEKLGIGPGWMISVPDEADAVEETAARILQRLLRRGGVNAPVAPESKAAAERRILLGRECSSPAVRKLGDEGTVRIRDVSPEDDGFHVKGYGGGIAVAGANPRGVLYGAYALEEFIRGGGAGPPDVKSVPFFRKRMDSPGYYFNPAVNLVTAEFTEEKAEYLSRLGVNQYLSGDTCFNMNLRYMVRSDVFPFQEPPDENIRRKVKSLSSILKKYGIDYYHSVYEPAVTGIDAQEYPPEAVGRVRRPWGGDKDGFDRTLCVNSPLVQAHLRNMMGQFVREFSDVKGCFFYNMDFNTWLCTPELCERCAQSVHDSPRDIFNPWETQAQLASLMAEAAHAERPDFDFNLFACHYHGDALDRLLRGAKGYNSLSVSWNGSDRDIMLPAVERPKAEFYMSQAAADDRGIPLYMAHEFNRLESCQPGFPYPFQVCGSLRRYREWGVKNLMEWGGPDPALNSINALVMKEYERDPDQDPAQFLHELSARQFGAAAGELMYRAWEEIRDGLDVWKGYMTHPFSGSQPYLGIGTILGLPPAILPDIADSYENDLVIRTNVEPWRGPEYQRFREKQFLEDFKRMGVHLSKAEKLAARAVRKAGAGEYIGLCYYEGSAEGMGRPTRREYAELNHAAIAISSAMCRQRIDILRAVHLLNEEKAFRAAGDAAGALNKKEQYRTLIREDVAMQERFIRMMTRFRGQRPCLVRVGITQQEIDDVLRTTQIKIAQLKEYLASNG